MLTAIGVTLIALALLCALLLNIYIYYIRINNRSGSPKVEEVTGEGESLPTEAASQLISSTKNKNKNNSKNKMPQIIKSESPKDSTTPSSTLTYGFVNSNEEDDLLALASLKGYDISGIRRRNNTVVISVPDKEEHRPTPPVKIEKLTAKVYEKIENVPVKVSERVEIISKTVDDFDSRIIAFVNETSELSPIELIAEKCPFKESESSSSLKIEDDVYGCKISVPSTLGDESKEWSQIPTREEEALKSLKSKTLILQSELEEIESKYINSSRQLEKTEKRVHLLELELLDQRKLSNSLKLSNEAQITSLRSVNRELMTKISLVESDAHNATILRKEVERAKESVSSLQTEIVTVEDQKQELFRQLSELRAENSFLREKIVETKSLSSKCLDLEVELEETRREMSLQVESVEAELQLTRVKLEGEIAFHCSEHANAVGSSTALHQEIIQLKYDLNESIQKESINESKMKELESEFDIAKIELSNLKSSLLEKDNEISKLDNELKSTEGKNNVLLNEISILKSEISSKNSKISESESTGNPSAEAVVIESLRNELAEAEIKMVGLRSDVAREIKRADISKKVYEAKLAELQK